MFLADQNIEKDGALVFSGRFAFRPFMAWAKWMGRRWRRLLERYATEGAVLLFDGDEAGRRAAERAFAELQNSRLDFRVALAEEGVDPADMVVELPGRPAADVEAGRARLRHLLDSAEDATTVFFKLLRQRLGLRQAVQVEQAAAECGRILQAVDSDVRRQALLEDMARHLGVSPQALGRMVGRNRRAAKTDPTSAETASPAAPNLAESPVFLAELELLGCLLAEPTLCEEFQGIPPQDPRTVALHTMMQEGCQEGHKSREALVRYLFSRCAEEPSLGDLLARCAERAARIHAPTTFLKTLETDRQAHQQRQEARGTRRRLQEALASGDHLLADRLTQLYVEQLRQS